MGAFLRRVALNALNQESTYRRSLAQKSQRAEAERQRAERLAAKLRELNINPEET